MISYLQIENLTKSFGDRILFENISLGIGEGDRIGLIAKNGAGKTTLLNILAGKENYDSGNIVFRNNLRVGYLEQSPSYPPELTVIQACFQSDNDTVRLIAEYEQALQTDDPIGLQELLDRMDHYKAWDYEQRAKQILSQLKIRNFDQKVKQLSGGQLKRVALANALITEPDLLILDEPTNHLDLDMTEWLEDYLRRTNLSLLMVTHDRYFLDRVCSEIIEIDNQQIYQYKGNYSYYLEKRQERIEAKSVEIERANNLYRTELDWMRRMPQARGHKARYREDAFYELEKVAKQRFNNDNVKLEVKASYIGSKIFEADHLFKSFGDLKILDDFSYIFLKGDRVGFIGPNGCGKSTLLRIIGNLDKPTSGTIEYRDGADQQMGFVFQDSVLLPWKNVRQNAEFPLVIQKKQTKENEEKLDELLELAGLSEFKTALPRELSGGMKQRVSIVRALSYDAPLLLMDEPFGALDALTRDHLNEELLKIWQKTKKTVIFVTHSIEEATFLSDRVLVMSARPGRVKEMVEIDLPRPRGEATRNDPKFTEYNKYLRGIIG